MRSLMKLAWLAGALAWAGPIEEAGDRDDGSFGMTPPIACKEIRGYADFEEWPDPALTKEDKLLVYFTPRHYKTRRVKDVYQAHFTEDGRIRRKGEKSILWSKKNLLDYKAVSERPPQQIYIRNMIGLKELKPGEYVLEIVLRDEVGQGAPAVRSLPFKVIPVAEKADSTKDESKTPRESGDSAGRPG